MVLDAQSAGGAHASSHDAEDEQQRPVAKDAEAAAPEKRGLGQRCDRLKLLLGRGAAEVLPHLLLELPPGEPKEMAWRCASVDAGVLCRNARRRGDGDPRVQ